MALFLFRQGLHYHFGPSHHFSSTCLSVAVLLVLQHSPRMLSQMLVQVIEVEAQCWPTHNAEFGDEAIAANRAEVEGVVTVLAGEVEIETQ